MHALETKLINQLRLRKQITERDMNTDTNMDIGMSTLITNVKYLTPKSDTINTKIEQCMH